MSKTANVNRLATARTLNCAMELIRRTSGLVIQTHRAYECASRPGNRGLTQDEVAQQAGTKQSVISDLERGMKIPADLDLEKILAASGFAMGKGGGGAALFRLLQLARNDESVLKMIEKEKPV